ncbi:MAG: tetratricopeptide repeat protein [bacterium]|nr:tetratricopeptide repeat protein [bacterium]
MTRPSAPLRRLTALALFAALATGVSARTPLRSAAATVGLDDEGSLQDLLAKARRERDATLTRMREEVVSIVKDLDALTGRNTERAAGKLRKRLLDLGADCAPLLVPYLDVGTVPEDGEKLRGEKISEVLRSFASPAVTTELMEMASKGSRRGRLNALKALTSTPDPERVLPFLRDMFRTATGNLRQQALATLAEIGGPQASTLLAEALADKDDDVVDVAIRALGTSRSAQASASLLAYMKKGGSDEHIAAILDFYKEMPELLEEKQHLLALVGLAGSFDVSRPDTLRILDTLRRLELDAGKDLKKAMEPLVGSNIEEVSEAALIMLARAKDKNAKRRLIAKYDERVKKQKDWASVYEDRADILYKIGDYSRAIKDYKDAIEMRSNGSREAAPFIGIARCYALMGRYKDAAEYLNNAPVSMVTLRELARDPDFAGMLESKYVKSFHLPK